MKMLMRKSVGLPDAQAQLPRLNRVTGQLEGVKRMIAANRSCDDVLTQLRSARAAIRSIESSLLSAHLQRCLAQSITGENSQAEALSEVKALISRFGD